MVRHVVMFEFAKEFEGKSAIEHAVTVKGMLLRLKDQIDTIRRMEVGINDAEAETSNFTMCLTCDFDSIEDLNVYSVHPEHLKVSAYIGKIKVGRACVDYITYD